MSLRNTLSLMCAVWAVRRGRAERIVQPGKFKVWREAHGVVCVELLA